jgi:hypothetical protein
MPKSLLMAAVFLAGVVPLGPSAIDAQPAAPTQPTPQPYNPGFGDLMNTLVQPRHAKLGLAGQDQNWPLAEYALHELKQSLATIARTRPRWRDFSLPEMIEAVAGESIQAIEQAVKAGDLRRFSEAYARLTEGCNSCHAATEHGYIVIKAPDRSTFANQDFRVVK